MADPNDNDASNNGTGLSKGFIIAISILAMSLLLTWAIATVFEVQLIKAFAMVVLAVFGVAIAALLAGVA